MRCSSVTLNTIQNASDYIGMNAIFGSRLMAALHDCLKQAWLKAIFLAGGIKLPCNFIQW
jgi:hypothetical protein